jgi:hypothetical protein
MLWKPLFGCDSVAIERLQTPVSFVLAFWTVRRCPTIAEMNRIRLVLLDMNNRIFGPYLAAIQRILISAMHLVTCRVQGKDELGEKVSRQHLILGTHTSEGEQNYLMRAEVALPLEDSETDARGYDEEKGEVGGFGSAAGKVQV